MTATHTSAPHAPANPKFPERTDRFEKAVADRKADVKELPRRARPDSRRETDKLYMENVPKTPADIKASWVPYNDLRTAGFINFDSDGELYVVKRPSKADNVQVHRVGAPMGPLTVLTHHPDGVDKATPRPHHNDEFVFGKDTKGDEFDGLFLQKPDGSVTELTEPGTRNNGNFFTPDGKTMVWVMTRRNDPTYTLMMMDVDKPESRREVFKSPLKGLTYAADLSVDGKTMLVGQYISVTEGHLYTLDLASGKLTEINPTNRKISYGGSSFTADGKSVIVTTDDGSEFKRLAKIDLATGAVITLTGDTNWDVENYTLSADRKRIAYTTNEDGVSKLNIRDIDSWQSLPTPTLPLGLVSGVTFDESGDKLGFSLNAGNSPGAPHTWDLKSQKLDRWVEADLGGLDPTKFVAPELIHYTNKNGDQIPAFIYKPANLKPGQKTPVIVEFHGGPESQSRPYFDKEVQYYVSQLGATVILPNVRGSTGYGKTYTSLDNGENRKKSVEDAGDLFYWIGQQPDLDKDRIAVMGGSYGGYMTAATLVDYPDLVVGGVEQFGPINYNTFLKNTEGYRRELRRVEYGDESNPAMSAWMDKIAPSKNAAKIKDPVLVVQGSNDPRVPQSESDQFVNEMRRNGNDVWYVLGDEGHGFSDLENIWTQREVQTQFFRSIFDLDAKPKKKGK